MSGDEIFDKFDEFLRRLAERNNHNAEENLELFVTPNTLRSSRSSQYRGTKRDRKRVDLVDILSRMVGVYKSQMAGEDTDLMDRLRLVSEAANEMEEGIMAEFAKIFVHMHTNELKAAPSRNPPLSTITPSSSFNSNSSSSPLPSTSSKTPSTPKRSEEMAETILEGVSSAIPWVGPPPRMATSTPGTRGRGRPPKQNTVPSSPSMVAQVVPSNTETPRRGASSHSTERSDSILNESAISSTSRRTSKSESTGQSATPSESRGPSRRAEGSASSSRNYPLFTPPIKKKEDMKKIIELVDLDDSSEGETKAAEDIVVKMDRREEKKEEVEKDGARKRRVIDMSDLRMEELNENGKRKFVLRRSQSAKSTPSPPTGTIEEIEDHEDEITVADEPMEFVDTVPMEAMEEPMRQKRQKMRVGGADLSIDMVDARLDKDDLANASFEGPMTIRQPRGAKDAAAAKLTTKKAFKKVRPVPTASKRPSGSKAEQSSIDKEKERKLLFEASFSPRSKKARVELKKASMIIEPEHARRGGDDVGWYCGSMSKCLSKSRPFEKSSDMYSHMLQEHYLEGAIVAKCLDCGQVGQFCELILHRKEASKDTCGGSHARLAYWCTSEVVKDEDLMDDDEKKMKREQESAAQLAKLLQVCVIKGCGHALKSFELLANHMEEQHKVRLRYGCPNDKCNRIFTQPLSFIRHRQITCEGAVPNITLRPIKEKNEEANRQ